MAWLAGNDEIDEKWARVVADWEVVYGPVDSWSVREREAVELFEPLRGVESWEVARVMVAKRRAWETVQELRPLLAACAIDLPFLTAKVDRFDRPYLIPGQMTVEDGGRFVVVLRAGLLALGIPPTPR